MLCYLSTASRSCLVDNQKFLSVDYRLLHHNKKHLWFIINQGAGDDFRRQPLFIKANYLFDISFYFN
ncbi:MAG: hypothetical protein KME32_05415 [Mojavia pulchra JT2-VF2]|uniref:Uncharacterized protein n=1 Tax=Mojavia pulchra JT2-VF2 TaxID=287848 RepID=A0A951PW82_9NOST|nr:hypothetical protein [Mojavia pulchra JT2-VF2]